MDLPDEFYFAIEHHGSFEEITYQATKNSDSAYTITWTTPDNFIHATTMYIAKLRQLIISSNYIIINDDQKKILSL
jgi:hypothetical protein